MVGVAEVALTDGELIAACLRGEQSAWDRLVDRYAALIYSIPIKYGLAEPDAADVFQSVCITWLEKLSSIRDPQRLAAWLITTTTRECWALLRQRQREARLATSEEPEMAGWMGEPMDPAPLPEDELLALERQVAIRAAVEQLPANCRELVEALFTDTAQRSSYQQLAHGLGIPLNSLGPTRARCLGKLRRLLEAAAFFD